MELIIIVSCLLVIALIVLSYEVKLSELNRVHRATLEHNDRLIVSSDRLVFDYKVLVDVLSDHFTEDEMNEMFFQKRSENIEKMSNSPKGEKSND